MNLQPCLFPTEICILIIDNFAGGILFAAPARPIFLFIGPLSFSETVSIDFHLEGKCTMIFQMPIHLNIFYSARSQFLSSLSLPLRAFVDIHTILFVCWKFSFAPPLCEMGDILLSQTPLILISEIKFSKIRFLYEKDYLPIWKRKKNLWNIIYS